ncbi:MAG: DinB family protein [Pseudomonadota bacterium]
MNHLQSLVRYKQWANQLVYAAVMKMPNKEVVASRSIVFGSMIRTLHHTLAMDEVWRAHLQNQSHGFTTRNPESCPTLGELNVAQREMDAWYVTYVDGLSESESREIIEFEFIGGRPGSMSRADMLIHVVHHGTYHRGNVTGMMYDCSVEPPTTDYSVFITQEG